MILEKKNTKKLTKRDLEVEAYLQEIKCNSLKIFNEVIDCFFFFLGLAIFSTFLIFAYYLILIAFFDYDVIFNFSY